jgi:hypothetical protein
MKHLREVLLEYFNVNGHSLVDVDEVVNVIEIWIAEGVHEYARSRGIGVDSVIRKFGES